jgi:hypothetical protein
VAVVAGEGTGEDGRGGDDGDGVGDPDPGDVGLTARLLEATVVAIEVTVAGCPKPKHPVGRDVVSD